MSKIKCFKCDGKGYTVNVDWFAGIFTLGLSVLIDKEENREKCDACDGKGYLEN